MTMTGAAAFAVPAVQPSAAPAASSTVSKVVIALQRGWRCNMMSEENPSKILLLNAAAFAVTAVCPSTAAAATSTVARVYSWRWGICDRHWCHRFCCPRCASFFCCCYHQRHCPSRDRRSCHCCHWRQDVSCIKSKLPFCFLDNDQTLFCFFNLCRH